MKKNIAILALSVALLFCLFHIVEDQWNAAQMRAANQLVRTSMSKVWKGACEHAAGGNRDRIRWCEWAAEGTAQSISERASDDDMRALALQYIEAQNAKVQAQRPRPGQDVKVRLSR
jgi:hypothetical protein